MAWRARKITDIGAQKFKQEYPGNIMEAFQTSGETFNDPESIMRARKSSITDPTYYRWRQEYGGLKLDQAKRLKDLERENARFKRAVADLTPDKLFLAEHGEGGRLDTMPLAAFVKARTHLLMLEGGDARELDPFVRGS